MGNENNKSDVSAKEAYVKELQKNGFKAQIVKAPADITAEKDGLQWYFEIKKTAQTDKYFGAATMTEWKQALEDSDHYRFVIAIDLGEGTWDFREYTPSELMKYSTIPPFKVYFNVSLTEEKPKKRKSNAVKMSQNNFSKLTDTYEQLDRG
jgi:hypothetical protein